jgi:hypothetical protein
MYSQFLRFNFASFSIPTSISIRAVENDQAASFIRWSLHKKLHLFIIKEIVQRY